MNISGIDLNLLLAFEALMDERNVGRAAKRVGLSQPAFSNAIARLRARIGDSLFVPARCCWRLRRICGCRAPACPVLDYLLALGEWSLEFFVAKSCHEVQIYTP